MESPCTNICTLRDDGLCAGCWRSLDEIVAWSALTSAERLGIMAELAARAAAATDEAVISNFPSAG
ncbi:DUF1289 domain-containing protein [Falsigemmobacter faecalis]|uniref:DUF1289 domain-containing protein n=1 Tax=Falsigemmobacter faecalis TaxID=2488730 RepID=UPI001F244F3A|nr:DUF1289 domain-containing protein [Falsigemmobacter faecalis]